MLKRVWLLPIAAAATLALSGCGAVYWGSGSGTDASYGSVAANTPAGNPTPPGTGSGTTPGTAPAASAPPATTPPATAPSTTKAKSPKTATGSRTTSPFSRYLVVDSAAKTVTLSLLGGDTSVNGGFSFNGTSGGAMIVTVPQGWKMTVNFKNVGSFPHSAAVVTSASSQTPAFPGATTPNPITGQAPGQSAAFTFVAAKTGTYRIACLVPGHEPGGMWATLDVVAAGTPSIQ